MADPRVGAVVNTGAGVIFVGALVASGWLWWHRDAPKTCTGLALLCGLILGGVLGRVISALSAATAAAPAGAVSSGVGVWLSVIAAGVGIAATAELVVKGMWPKRANPRRWHPLLALALPTLLIATGVPLVGPLMAGLAGGVTNVGAAISAAHSTPSGHR